MSEPDFSAIPGLIADIEVDAEGTVFNQHEARTGRQSEIVIIPFGGSAGRVLIWDRKLSEAEKDQIESMLASMTENG